MAATGCTDPDDERVVADARRRRLLLQVDSSASAGWGDAGMLYWPAPGGDVRDLTGTAFAWQSA